MLYALQMTGTVAACVIVSCMVAYAAAAMILDTIQLVKDKASRW